MIAKQKEKLYIYDIKATTNKSGDKMRGNSGTTAVDEHIGQRLQLRRVMLGLSQKDLADACGISFQQIQKYESAGNRISASRLFELSTVLETPVSFFFRGLPGNTPEEKRNGRRQLRVSDGGADDPLSKNESLQLVNLYWRLPNDEQRKMVLKMLKTLNGVD